MQRLTLVGPVNSYTGYGKLTIDIARDIEKFSDTFVSIRSLSSSEAFGASIPHDIKAKFVDRVQPEPFELLHHPPIHEPTPGKRTAILTMGETTRLRAREVAILNRTELVINPSKWGADCFSASGVNTKIAVVPLGVDAHLFRYRATQPGENKSAYIFGAAGRMAHGGARKGIAHVIECFQRAFPTERNVELRVKVFPDCQLPQTRDPRIKILRAYLSDEAFSDWVSGLDCFVSASLGEGFGLIQLQAMRVGLPVLCVPWSGVTEYYNANVGYPFEYDLKPAENYYRGAGLWAVPRTESVIKNMRYCYENPMEAFIMGQKASEAAMPFTKDAFGKRLVEVLKEGGLI